MAEAPRIDPQLTLPAHQDFQRLRDEAVTAIGATPGARWSDMNASEPGVTLLEAAVDALADLGYRLEHPVADLLTPDGAESDWQPLPGPAAVLGCQPVSQGDLEAVLADHPAIARAALEPQDHAAWLVRLTPRAGAHDPAALRHAAWRAFHRHRPLGTRPGAVVLQQDVALKLYPELELAEHAQVEDTLAALVRRWQDALSAEGRYQDAATLLAAGQTGDRVYDGPTLAKGVRLTPGNPQRQILASELIELALAVPGVARVDSLLLGDSDGRRDEGRWQWLPGPDDALRLDVDTLLDWWSGKLVLAQQQHAPLHRDGQRLPLDADRLRQKLAQPDAAPITAATPTAPARYRRLSLFPPFALALPSQFGLSRSGLNPAATPAEHAPVLQLQAYLLPLEQLLADQAAQLDNVRRLLELPAGPWLDACGQLFTRLLRSEALSDTDVDRFWLTVRELPPTLRRQPVEPLPTADHLFDADALTRYRRAGADPALEGLLSPRWLERSTRRLRHLLARYGDTQPDAALLRYRGVFAHYAARLAASRYAPALPVAELTERLAALKEVLDLASALIAFPELSSTRGQGADLIAGPTGRSGAEWRVAQRLGMTLDDAPLSLGNREGALLVEGALLIDAVLRLDPALATVQGLPLEDCVFWVLPAQGTRLGHGAFRQLVESVLSEETPLHLVPWVCWLAPDDLNIVEGVYRHWRAKWCELGPDPGPARRTRLDSAGLTLLGELLQQDRLARPDSRPWQTHVGENRIRDDFTVGYPDLPPRPTVRFGGRIGDDTRPYVVAPTPPLPLND